MHTIQRVTSRRLAAIYHPSAKNLIQRFIEYIRMQRSQKTKELIGEGSAAELDLVIAWSNLVQITNELR